MNEAINIVAIRRRMGWSQADLARFLEINRSTVSRFESGELEPRGSTRKLLAQLASARPAVVTTGSDFELDEHGFIVPESVKP